MLGRPNSSLPKKDSSSFFLSHIFATVMRSSLTSPNFRSLSSSNDPFSKNQFTTSEKFFAAKLFKSSLSEVMAEDKESYESPK